MTMDLNKFKKIRALVLGDLMIDEYLWGEVDRISPEAPVPIVSVINETYTLGGAGNVINNLVAMGAGVSVVGTAGTGTAGRMMLDKFKELGVDAGGIIDEPDRPTTKKTRVIASNQQVLRIDKETKKEISSTTLTRLISFITGVAPRVDLIIISDYDKGLVTRELVRQTVAIAKSHNILVLADPKGLDFTKYSQVSVLTPNQKEAGIAAGIDIKTDHDLIQAGLRIMASACIERLVITCGRDGMMLLEQGKTPVRIASQARQVFDVSGAGDTVISILGLALAAGAGFEESAAIANAAAGIVVGKVGTATASPDELELALKNE
ncbi:putative carbohydrate kinase (PfkB family protein) [Desulforapulum autotrophicum HRM2]|uniref:Carbohydrate kinase (PfkB family protein) n=2 Tax=Desulforapulum autotrophicum TaxID=2296 RepID=C0Q8X3_DESAH|nr:putative carbohydrate kinase (PfkB family protein) [Desulforapulum autotrophicum HRM2]